MVKVYSKNNCMQCKMTKRYLTENQISFEEVNIDNEPEALGFLKDQGFQSVPVISVDNKPLSVSVQIN